MITTDQLDDICLLTYKLAQGRNDDLKAEDWELLEEIAVHIDDLSALMGLDLQAPSDMVSWDTEDFDPEQEVLDHAGF